MSLACWGGPIGKHIADEYFLDSLEWSCRKMMIEKFAEPFRLHVKRDECGDNIVLGKRGHLYFAGGELCLMVIDGPVVNRRRWQALGRKLWLGDSSSNVKGRNVPDVKIEGIPIRNFGAAIKLVRARQKRVLSAEQREVLLARLPKAS